MKKKFSIQVLIVLAVFAIFLMQGLWLRNSYITNKELVKNKINSLFIYSIDKEVFLRQKGCYTKQNNRTNDSTIIVNVTQEDIEKIHSPIDVSLQEALAQDSCFVSLNKLHAICQEKMKEENIRGTFIIQHIDMLRDSLLESTVSERQASEASFATKTIPIRLKEKEGVRLLLLKPHWTIFRQMLLILALSIALMSFVFFALYRQLHLFLKEKKLRQLQKDHTEAMVHTMKTPLQSITQVHEFIAEGSFDNDLKKRNHFIDLASKQIRGLQALVNRILSISQWETSTLTLHKTPVNVSKLLLLLCEKAKQTAIKDITITTELKLEQTTFLLDKETIEDVIQNLLENAIKYSKQTVTIFVTAMNLNDALLIKIKDNGLGISAKAQKTIFKKFERGDAPFRQGAKGFGLGLAFSKGIVEAHGGTIAVKSQEGKGAEFCIQIPIKQE